MLKMLKKYRSNPKRMVVTFSCQRKITLNRLGDLNDKNEIQRELYLKEQRMPKKDADYRAEEIANGCDAKQDCGCTYASEDNCYLTENDERFSSCERLKSKRALVEREQAQILENDESSYAFKQNYHIKPLEYRNSDYKDNESPMKPQREMRGGIVMEKSFKMLLCDVVAIFGVMVALACALSKVKRVFRG